MKPEGIARASRLTAGLGAVVLFVSLFLTWSARPNFLVLFGSGIRVGRFVANTSTSGWEVYSVADVALAALAVLIVFAAVSKRASLLVAGLIGALAGLAFTFAQLSSPPGASAAPVAGFGLRANLARQVLAPTAESGETVATIALLAAIAGLGVALSTRREAPT